jgi:hypothetical protein
VVAEGPDERVIDDIAPIEGAVEVGIGEEVVELVGRRARIEMGANLNPAVRSRTASASRSRAFTRRGRQPPSTTSSTSHDGLLVDVVRVLAVSATLPNTIAA